MTRGNAIRTALAGALVICLSVLVFVLSRSRQRAVPAPAIATERAARPAPTARECASQLSEDCPAFPASPEVLRERARCGTLVIDTPAFLDMDDDQLAEVSAKGTAEDVSLVKMRQAFRGQVMVELDALYRELAGPSYREVDDFALLKKHLDGLARAQAPEIRKRLAEERAGLRAPPPPSELANRPPAERVWRLLAGVGDRYEAALAKAIGPELARARRQESGGWSQRHLSVGTCPGEH